MSSILIIDESLPKNDRCACDLSDAPVPHAANIVRRTKKSTIFVRRTRPQLAVNTKVPRNPSLMLWKLRPPTLVSRVCPAPGRSEKACSNGELARLPEQRL